MSIVNLNFLKYKPGFDLAKCDLYAKMCDTEGMLSELEEMPADEILAKIAVEFSDWDSENEYEYSKSEAGFFIGMLDNMMCFECNDMEQDDIDRIIAVMAGFGIAPFNMQIGDMVELEF